MTRAVKSVVRRIVGVRTPLGHLQEYVVEVRADVLRMRPLRTRQGGAAEIAVKWGALYQFGFVPPKRKRRVKRGLLTT